MRIRVVGLGVDQQATLSASAMQALAESDIVYGSSRQRETVAGYLGYQEQRNLPKLPVLKAELEAITSSVTVLASGDPLFYGIGKWLGTHFGDSVQFFPAVSSIQAACHRLGVSLQTVTVISLHGRSLHEFRRKVRQGQQYLFLTDTINTPEKIAQETLSLGFEKSTLTVFERLGYADEKRHDVSVQALSAGQYNFDALNVCFLQAEGHGGVLPDFPGIEDHRFFTESKSAMITKREVRLAVLSLLQPKPNDVGWDVGAGCGSVAVEWSLWSNTQVFAIEPKKERLACIEKNKSFFGAGNLAIIEGVAPEAFSDLPTPDAIFVGGSEGETLNILEQAFHHLKSSGRMVVSAVTEETQFAVQQFLNTHQLAHEMIDISIKKKTPLGKKYLLKPALPVRLIKVEKP